MDFFVQILLEHMSYFPNTNRLGQNSVIRPGIKPQYLTAYQLYDTNFKGKSFS